MSAEHPANGPTGGDPKVAAWSTGTVMAMITATAMTTTSIRLPGSS